MSTFPFVSQWGRGRCDRVDGVGPWREVESRSLVTVAAGET